MPIRHATLYRKLDDQPATAILDGGITQVRANLRKQITLHLREGWRIRTDNGDDGVVLKRDDEIVLLTIEAEPLQKRARGGGRKRLDEDDPTRSRPITMPESYWRRMEEFGDGNASLGIRRMIERHASVRGMDDEQMQASQ